MRTRSPDYTYSFGNGLHIGEFSMQVVSRDFDPAFGDDGGFDDGGQGEGADGAALDAYLNDDVIAHNLG